MRFLFDKDVKELYQVTSEWKASEPFRSHPHTGIDLGLESGTDIYSPIEGTIKIADYGDQSTGKTVFVETENGETVIFGHLSDIDVKNGDIVNIGDLLGQSGSSGHSTGDHLHIGLKDSQGNFINPEDVENRFQEVAYNMKELREETGGMDGFFGTIAEIKNYFWRMKQEGFWEATFDRSFPELILDGIAKTFEFIFTFNDLFTVYPAIIFMFATFLIGNNKYTKWIVPCWLGYFATTILKYVYFGD